MIRKFVLLSLPAILRKIAPNLGIESALGMLMMLLSGMAYSSIHPYRNQRDQMIMLPTQIVQAIALLCGMVMEVIDESNKAAADIAITYIIILTCTPLLLVMLAYLYDPTGGMLVKALGNHSKLADSIILCDKLGLTKHNNVERLLEVFEEEIEDGDTSHFEETGAAMIAIWRLVASKNTDSQALEDALLGMLQSLGISRKEAQETILSSVMTAFIRKLEEKGFHQMVISRVEALLAHIVRSGGGPDTSGTDLDKLAPLGHAMTPLLLGDVSESNLVAVLRALKFTRDEADALILLAGLTQAHNIALNLGVDEGHESIVLATHEMNVCILAISKRAATKSKCPLKMRMVKEITKASLRMLYARCVTEPHISALERVGSDCPVAQLRPAI
jgi:hypothetical protein